MTYGVIVAASGALMYRQGIKRHFLEAYLHIAANTIFAALVSGADDGSVWAAYLLALLMLSSAAIALGVRFHRFAFVAYGTVYGYAGISATVLPILGSAAAFFGYFCFTGSLVILSLVVLARRFGRTE